MYNMGSLGGMGGMPYGMGVPYGPAYFPMPFGHGYHGQGPYGGQVTRLTHFTLNLC